MDSEQKLLHKPYDLSSGASLINNSIEDTICDMAFWALLASQVYKQPRMDQIMLYEKLYNNDVPKQFRQLYNLVIPVFSGLIDTLEADLNSELATKFEPKKPSDYLVLPKIQAHFDAEKDSLAPTASWNSKAKDNRHNAMLSGRGIRQFYSESEPEYRNVLEVINYSDFHCDPLGGVELENHLFAGREGIFKTLEEIVTSEQYPAAQRKKFKDFSYASEWYRDLQDNYGTKLTRFTSLGLDPVSNSYAGDRVVNLCRFIITFQGMRYRVLFDPITRIWLEVEKWDKPYIWVSEATHRDQKNFWSKGFADDFFKIAEAINTFYNQEATNRERQNNKAIAFDPLIFDDPERLDDWGYRPDVHIPVNTQGGTKKISEGIFEFNVQGLNGTIDLTQNLMNVLGNYTGANELSMGGSAAQGQSKKPSVVIAQQQQLAKRIGFRSDSFKEADARLAERFIMGMKENMPTSVSVNLLGENGFVEESELKRIEVDSVGMPTIKVISTSDQENLDNVKKQSKVQALEMINENPMMSKFQKELILREVGGFEESQIQFALDELPYTARKQIAKASQAIQDIERGKKPSVYYAADRTFVAYIVNWKKDNADVLIAKKPDVYKALTGYLALMQPIVVKNMQDQAKQDARKAQQAAAAQGGGQSNQDQPAGQGNTPVVAAAQKMGMAGAQ